MMAARTIGGPAYPKMIEEMARGLNSIIEDVDRTVYVKVLHLMRPRRKLSFFSLSIVDPQEFGVERGERERTDQRRIEKSE